MKRFLVTLHIMLLLIVVTPLLGQSQAMADFNENTRLAVTAKVWGFLKYYHPKATTGQTEMDQILIDFIDDLRNAPSKEAFNAELQHMILHSGKLNLFSFSFSNVEVPLLDWFDTNPHLTPVTANFLKQIKRTHIPGDNRYVEYGSFEVKNTTYKSELKYHDMKYPNENYRLLALFRYWNIIDFFFPYRDLIDENWDDVLIDMIPKFIAAGDAAGYNLAVLEIAARIDDAHGFVKSEVKEEHIGSYLHTFNTRFIEEKTVITSYDERLLRGAELRVGDVVEAINDVPTDVLREQWRKYTCGSNPWTVERNINALIFRGHTDRIKLTLSNDDGLRTVEMDRIHIDDYPAAPPYKKSDTWHIKDGNIGYIHMGRLPVQWVDDCMADLMGTRAIIFDIRNYPQGTMWELDKYLLPDQMVTAEFTVPDLNYPGNMIQLDHNDTFGTVGNADYYKGKIVILCDDRTQSQAEYTIMALQATPDNICIGSATAGADGNVSIIPLPGEIEAYFTGIGVFYPDLTPTQQVGIRVDITITPTIRGLRDGRDELMEKALEVLNQ